MITEYGRWGHGTSEFTASWSHVWVTLGFMLEVGQSWETVSSNSGTLVSEVN